MPNYWYHHIHLASPDPRKTAEFYEDMFSAEITNTRELPGGSVTVELNLGGSMVLIMQRPAETESAPSGASSGLDHFGLRTDDLETTVANLKTKGVQFRGEIMEIGKRMKIAFFWAPDNVLIELVEVKPRE